MEKTIITFEIWDVAENEMLVDNLSFEEMMAQLETYKRFFGAAVVVPVCRERKNNNKKIVNTKSDFTRDWLALMDELCLMDNMY